ncbi:MAG: efflux RND transporter periplasmic adaptor subunit [Gemmatimonadaceae bacterium]
MKTRNTRLPLATWAVAVTCLLVPTVQAAGQSGKFTVPNAQLQALGIKTTVLKNQTTSVKASFPAQVVVPTSAEEVLSSPVAGVIARLLVQQNQRLRAGAPLLHIVSPELGQLQLQLLQTGARATLARQTAQREQKLFDEEIIPQRRVQEAQAALKEAEAALTQAKAALRLSGMPATTTEHIAATGIPQDGITLTAVRAGVVTAIAVKPGQRVDAATALLHIAQTDALWLDIQVPVSESANWPAGTRIEVPDRGIAARITSASPMVASSSQTVVLRAAVERGTARLRPGEFVTVAMPIGGAKDAWDVPLSAVAHEGRQAYVFVRTADGFDARPVMVAASAGQRVRVQGSLKAGEQIAVSGVVTLKGAWLSAKERK